MVDDNHQDDDVEGDVLCRLCPDQQAPSVSSDSFKDRRIDAQGHETIEVEPREKPVMYWLGCEICEEWFHTACLAREVRREYQGRTAKKLEARTSQELDSSNPAKIHDFTGTFPQLLVEQLLQRSFFWRYDHYLKHWFVGSPSDS